MLPILPSGFTFFSVLSGLENRIEKSLCPALDSYLPGVSIASVNVMLRNILFFRESSCSHGWAIEPERDGNTGGALSPGMNVSIH